MTKEQIEEAMEPDVAACGNCRGRGIVYGSLCGACKGVGVYTTIEGSKETLEKRNEEVTEMNVTELPEGTTDLAVRLSRDEIETVSRIQRERGLTTYQDALRWTIKLASQLHV